MAVKAFCGLVDFQGYSGDPVDGFQVYVAIKIFNSDGPGADEFAATLNMSLGMTEPDMCEEMYQAILDRCAQLSWPGPTRDDVFCIRTTPIVRELPQS